jgi:hypothetical protein
MPGERRGGRTRATPNQRTFLADRMMAVLAGCSMSSPKECLSKLVNDAELPADIRMTVAQKAFPGRTGGGRPARRAKSEIPCAAPPPVAPMSQAARDVLLVIVSDASAPAKARRKAAAKLAAYFLPMKPVNKRWRFTADECGFTINAEIAREYRAIDFELRVLKRHPNQDFPEIAQRIQKLQRKKDAIHQRLTCPCPSRYGKEQIWEDHIRLVTLARKREDGFVLTAEEDAEEAHRKARFDSYAEGPEQTARRYRGDLEGADLRFRKSRFYRDGLTAPPLSRRQRNDLSLLLWLYPPHNSKSRGDRELEVQADVNMAIGHPFHDEEAVDGNFYPQDSKLRPAGADESAFVEFADVPPYCIHILGQPPIFTHELPINFSSDKSGPGQS